MRVCRMASRPGPPSPVVSLASPCTARPTLRRRTTQLGSPTPCGFLGGNSWGMKRDSRGISAAMSSTLTPLGSSATSSAPFSTARKRISTQFGPPQQALPLVSDSRTRFYSFTATFTPTRGDRRREGSGPEAMRGSTVTANPNPNRTVTHC